MLQSRNWLLKFDDVSIGAVKAMMKLQSAGDIIEIRARATLAAGLGLLRANENRQAISRSEIRIHQSSSSR